MSEVLVRREDMIFETENGSLSQSDATERFQLAFHQEELSFRVCELITFKRKLQAIDLPAMLMSENQDVEVLHMPHCDRLFVLTIQNILELKELLAGAFAMLELNSVIHRQLVRRPL